MWGVKMKRIQNFLFLSAIFLMAVSVFASGGKQEKIGNISIELPPGFIKHKTPERQTVKMLIALGPRRKDGTQCSIMINEIDISKFPAARQKRIPLDPFKNFDAFLGTMKKNYKNLTHSKVEAVDIDGLKFAKAEWEGTISHPRFGTFAMKGIFFVCRVKDIVYQFNYMDYANHFQAEYKKGEDAILGARILKPEIKKKTNDIMIRKELK